MEKITRLNWFKKVFGGVVALCAYPSLASESRHAALVLSDTRKNLEKQRYIEGVWKRVALGLQCEWIGQEPDVALNFTLDGENVGLIKLDVIKRFTEDSLTVTFNEGECVGTHPWPKERLALMKEAVSRRPEFALINWPSGGWSVERITHKNYCDFEELMRVVQGYVNGEAEFRTYRLNA